MWKVFKVNKKDTSKTKVNCCRTLVRFEQTLHLVCVLLWPFFENRAIAKTSWQSYFKKFEVLFSRKQQGAIRTDWKIYSCIFYHFCIMVTIFHVATSLSIFSTTILSSEQCRQQMKSNFIFTYANWNINLIIGFRYQLVPLVPRISSKVSDSF